MIDESREVCAVVLKWEFGKFIVENKNLWSLLSKDDCVEIHYKELYRLVYDKNKLINRKLYRYDFIDAIKIECVK